jgi:hypothetical protein
MNDIRTTGLQIGFNIRLRTDAAIAASKNDDCLLHGRRDSVSGK